MATTNQSQVGDLFAPTIHVAELGTMDVVENNTKGEKPREVEHKVVV